MPVNPLAILELLKETAANAPLQYLLSPTAQTRGADYSNRDHRGQQSVAFPTIGSDPFSNSFHNGEVTSSFGGINGGLSLNNLLGLITSNNPNAAPPPVASAAPPPPTISATPPVTTTPAVSAPPAGPAVTRPVGNSRFSVPNPFYSSVTSPLLNQAGNQIGTTPLNNTQFARPEMANALLQYFANTYGLKNGNIVTEQYAGGLGPSENELGIRFGNSNVLNAGLEYDRLQNRNGYSQQYLDAQFKDNLSPGSSGWNNYVTTGSMPGAMNSADAERAFAGKPEFDPNINSFGLQSKLNQVQYNPVGGVTPSGWEGPQAQQPTAQQTTNNWNQSSSASPGGFFGTTTSTTPFIPRVPSSSGPPPGYGGVTGVPETNGFRTPNSYNGGGFFSNSSTPFRSLPGNSGFSSYASALNNRAPLYNGSYNTRGNYGRGY